MSNSSRSPECSWVWVTLSPVIIVTVLLSEACCTFLMSRFSDGSSF
uniref:Uncharacterized protein n=1 Tax=Anguilla anguilla TaxID=7936 RepID=A0A0E9W0Y6_ANGAN